MKERFILPNFSIEVIIKFTSFSVRGIANPSQFAHAAIAVFIHTTSSLRFTRGPQLLPGLIAVSVWISPVSCSVQIQLPSQASILLPSHDMTPNVTVFWNSAKAFQMATTKLPTSTLLLSSTNFTAGVSLTAFQSLVMAFITAKSVVGSMAKTFHTYS
jgi:hypothetical protein